MEIDGDHERVKWNVVDVYLPVNFGFAVNIHNRRRDEISWK
jgi:hypothetical protein